MSENNTILIRPTGSGTIKDSIYQSIEFQDEDELKRYLTKLWHTDNYRIEAYLDDEDERCGWKQTFLILINNMPTYFMTEGITKDESIRCVETYFQKKI